MYKRAAKSLVGPLIALSLVAALGISYAQTNQNYNSATYKSDMNTHNFGPSAASVKVAQLFLDKDFSQNDLVSILPLLHDLRDAKQMCRAKHDAVFAEATVSKSGSTKTTVTTALHDCDKALTDRRRDIFNTISDRIGADKAAALRPFVEPVTEDVGRVAYTSENIRRIDTMLVELDKMAAARIAANGGTPENTVVTASVETRTTTTQVGTPIYVTTPAWMSEQDLIDAVEARIVANEIGNSDWMSMMPMHRDLTTADITFLREGKMMVWW